MMMLLVSFAVAAVVLAADVPPARSFAVSSPYQTTVVTARVVPSANGEPYSVQVPMRDGRAVEQTALRIANSVSAPVGIEYVDDALVDSNRPLKGGRAIVTGQRLSDVLTLITSGARGSENAAAGFTWQDNGAIVHITNLHQPSFLDTPVRSFAVENTTFAELLPVVHAILDSQFPPASSFGSAGSIGCDPTSDVRCQQGLDILHRKFSFRVEGGTDREVLDRAILSHGAASWVVRYHDASGAHARSDIAFSTFDGFTVELGAKPER
jgi:hypothetical protein